MANGDGRVYKIYQIRALIMRELPTYSFKAKVGQSFFYRFYFFIGCKVQVGGLVSILAVNRNAGASN